MNFDEAIQGVAASATVTHAQAAIRREHGRASTSWVAEQAGISPRTARRWMSAAAPPARHRTILNMAGAGAAAAQTIRAARTISVGRVRVRYDDTDAGTRTPPELTVAEMSLEPFYDALAAGDYEVADRLFSDAVLDAYGAGLDDILTIAEFDTGLALGR